jgi:hypothetical protein
MRHYRDAMRRLEVSDELADIGESGGLCASLPSETELNSDAVGESSSGVLEGRRRSLDLDSFSDDMNGR